MARKNKSKPAKGKDGMGLDFDSATLRSVLATAVFIAAAVLILSYAQSAGSAGKYIARALTFLLGSGYFFAPLTLILVGFSLIFAPPGRMVRKTLLGGVLFLLGSLMNFHILFGPSSGGAIGALGAAPLLSLFDFWAGLVIALGVLIIAALLMYRVSFPDGIGIKIREERDEEEIPPREFSPTPASTPAPEPTPAPAPEPALPAEKEEGLVGGESSSRGITLRKIIRKFDYKKPPLELLSGDKGKPSSGDIRANANIIKRTLENFGIMVDMDEVSVGPTVTQYTLKPAEGVKLSKIVALHNDLSLALAAHPIRIEAPIPGKSLVGVEVPNRSLALVGLRSLLEHKIFLESPNPLLVALGRDVTGTPVFADLARMPHLLVSGSTGSGKSVAIHAMVTSLVYRNPPEILRFIMVDPKRVELSVYNDIPHLLTPVITDSKKTIQSLRWATKEMDRRYDLLSSHRVRDIENYNAKISKSNEEEPLPFIVIIIDELADLMAVFPREVEAAIIRLAQMARAVGIHLLVATQRPSVEVITGLIKANITSRIAFQVASQVDSRTILDIAGAEKLLGSGDMLFLAGDTSKPRRIQTAFVSEPEVKRVVEFLCEEGEAPSYDEGIFDAKTNSEEEDRLGEFDSDDDPFYGEARELVMEAGRASASYLQRRLRIGYARAARILDLLEERGVIGPADGAKPREILINPVRNLHGDRDTPRELS